MQPRSRILVLLLLLPLAGRGQAFTPAVPATLTSFFTADLRPAHWSDSAAFCSETVFRDSIGALTKVYYPSGQLREFVPYADVYRRTKHGVLTTWYETGQLNSREEYLNGVRQGELLVYYPNGVLKRRDRYVNGRSGVGACYGPAGQPVPYFGYEQPPLYPGGTAELSHQIARAMSLNSLESGAFLRAIGREEAGSQFAIHRRIELEVAVAADGQVNDVRVVQPGFHFLTDAAQRAVAGLQRRFVPARRDNQVLGGYVPVTLYCELDSPIRFTAPSTRTRRSRR